MDSKNLKNPRLADLDLSTHVITAAVADIPGASIVSDNVELDLTQFGESGSFSVVLAEAAGEIASLSLTGDVATLDFTSAVTTATIVRVTLKQSL